MDLEGGIRPAPEDPAKTLKLSAEDARVLEERGAHVNATEVTPKG